MGSYCKVRKCNLTSMHDRVFQSRARSQEKSGCNEYITSIAITRHFICLFLRFNEYMRLELDCGFKGSTRFQSLQEVL